uniref:CID domain-containing protein n=1 Tax=Labrus bergylta TaxID=56723 RepID=A0A3Q3E4D3_9LABR
MDCLLINGHVNDKSRLGLPGSLRSKMDDSAARDDACREYQSSLEDLTFNSKPHINMLTILAEENLHFAKDIVAIIEAQISKVFINIEILKFQLFLSVYVRRPSRLS